MNKTSQVLGENANKWATVDLLPDYRDGMSASAIFSHNKQKTRIQLKRATMRINNYPGFSGSLSKKKWK